MTETEEVSTVVKIFKDNLENRKFRLYLKGLNQTPEVDKYKTLNIDLIEGKTHYALNEFEKAEKKF